MVSLFALSDDRCRMGSGLCAIAGVLLLSACGASAAAEEGALQRVRQWMPQTVQEGS